MKCYLIVWTVEKKCRIMASLICAICGSKRFRFIKMQETSGIWSSVGLKSLLSKVALLGNIYF